MSQSNQEFDVELPVLQKPHRFKLFQKSSTLSSGLMALFVVCSLEVGQHLGLAVPIPIFLLSLVVLAIAYFKGFKAGLMSATIVSLYVLYAALSSFAVIASLPNLSLIIPFILIMFAGAILVGCRSDQSRRQIIQLQTTQKTLETQLAEQMERCTRLEAENRERQKTDILLQNLILETASVTGSDFFPALVQHLATALGVKYALVSESLNYPQNRARTLAFWGGDRFLENLEYEINQLPCSLIFLEGKVCLYRDQVPELFPEHQLLKNLGIISFLGFPLYGRSGKVIGDLCILDDKPFFQEDRIQSLLRIFAGRAVAELERKQAEEAQKKAEEKYRSIFENAIEGIFQTTSEGRYISANPALARIYGYDSPTDLIENLTNIPVQLYVDPHRRVELMEMMVKNDQVSGFEYQVYRKDGSIIWISENCRAVRDQGGNLLYYEGTVEDITQRKKAEEKLLYNAFYDELTGLPNRALFMDRLQQSLAHSQRRPNNLFAVLYIDIDRFKIINDSLGHSVGNQLLIELSSRLVSCLREGDTVARLNGDEFAVLVEDILETSAATQIAERIQKALNLPCLLEEQEVFVSASIGIAFNFQTSGRLYDSAEELLRDADTAMHYAKNLGQGCHQLFNRTMQKNFRSRLQLETALRYALERQELLLHYQPIVSLLTAQISGFEALVRWQHPEWGLVSPTKFIPLAEETGLIVPIGEWVLKTACQELRKWQLQGWVDSSITMSVNVAGRQFAQPKLVPMIQDILAQTGLAAHNLRLEITEGVIMEHFKSATTQLQQLRDLGIQLSIDDFGTGYSSLSRLQQFPIDILKIDRSFVSKLTANGNREIIETIINLALIFKMNVVAEGVETLDQLVQLQELKCHYAQGYLFSKPVEGNSIKTLMQNPFLIQQS